MDTARAFRAKNGISFNDETFIISGATGPSLGVPADKGSLYLYKPGSGSGAIFVKQSDSDTDWVQLFDKVSNYSATTAPTVNDDITSNYDVGSVWIDTTNDAAYLCLDNTDGAAVWYAMAQSGDNISKTITIEDPAVENLTFFRTDKAITIVEVIGINSEASKSVTVSIRHSTDRSTGSPSTGASGTITSNSTGTTFTNGTTSVPADSWIWVDITAVTTQPSNISIDLRYEET